jgi:molybdate transport system ATP-binding protein
MRRGENWAVLGPNGAGKSTILKLVLGEHLQVYSNKVWVFEKRRGSGESIWDIKKRIGVVSSELQVHYRRKISAVEVVISGLHDSVGLYRRPTAEEEATAQRWIRTLGVEDLAKQPFDQLSYGQKRMVLLARAMVKSPALLIVDEPCHGLDIPNRARILDLLERVGRTRTSLLYVTNHREEILSCITHVLRLQKGEVLRQGKKEEVL